MIESNKKIMYLRTDHGTQDIIGGGSVSHTLGVLKGFFNHGYDIVCVSSAIHKILESIKNPRFTFIKLTVPYSFERFGFKIACLLSNVIFYYKIKKLLKEQKVDLIYQRYSMLNVVGVWLSRYYKIPLVLEFNGSEVWVDEHWSHSKVRATWLLRCIEYYNLKHAHKVIVVSQVLKDQLIEHGIDATKIEINLNGVDIDIFNPVKLITQRSIVRQDLHVEEKFVIGFSGTFGPWHGVDVLSYVIPKVVREYPKVHFLLMGDGPLKSKLMATMRHESVLSGVTFLGMLHTQEMPIYLSACDAFICPTQPNTDGTRFFGSPTKLFEYMAMGKPIIASDLEQLAYVLDMPECAQLLITPHEHIKFYEAIVKLISMDMQEHYKIGVAVQEKVEQYTWNAHVSRMVEAIKELM